MEYFFFVLALMHAPVPLSAESAPPPAQRPTFAPAKQSCKNIVVFVFGTWANLGSTIERQIRLLGAAKQQSGIDQKAPASTCKTSSKKSSCKCPLRNASVGCVKGPAGSAGGDSFGCGRIRLRIGREERLSKGIALPNGA